MADRHRQVAGRDLFAAGQAHADHLAHAAALFDQHVVHARFETDLAAEPDDLGPHLFDHLDQAEGADVRLADVHDLFRCAEAHELGQDLAAVMVGVLDLAVQLAVREGAGAAFAELHVRLGIELALAPEAEGVDGALAHDLAALEDDRIQAHLGQHQRHEQAAGAGADYDRTRGARGRLAHLHELVVDVGRGHHVLVLLEARQHRSFAAHFGVDRIDQHDGGLLARIVAALVDGEVDQVGVLDAEAGQDGLAQGRFGVVQGEFEFVNTQHERVVAGEATKCERANRYFTSAAGIGRDGVGALAGRRGSRLATCVSCRDVQGKRLDFPFR